MTLPVGQARGSVSRFFSDFGHQGATLLPWAILASLLVGLLEVLLLPKNIPLESSRIPEFVLLSAGLCTFVTIPATIVFSGFGAMATVLSRRSRHPKTIAGAVFALTILPYALGLGRFTFSGPTVVGLWYQPIVVGLFTLIVAVAFSLALRLYLYPTSRVLRRSIQGGTLFLGGGASLLLNQQVVPGQYEPLHTLLSISTCVCLLLALTQIRPMVALRTARGSIGRRFALGLLFLSTPLLASRRLPLAPKVGALITQSSTTPRYLVFDWGDSNSATREVDELIAQVKPSVVAPRALEARRVRSQRRPNIVFFFVDNLSPTRSGFLGYRKNPTTPNIDRLANTGAVFAHAYSSIPHTRLFATSLIIGHYSHLSATDRMMPHFIENSITNLLHRHDYHIMAQNWFELSRGTGFRPQTWGVDTYVRPPTPEEEAATQAWPVQSMPVFLEKIAAHLDDARRTQAPVFLWVHQVNPHGIPRNRPGMYAFDPQFSFGPTLDDRYDGAVASADQWFAPIKKLLDEKLTHPENTYYVFGSDHGSGINRFRKKVSKTTWQDHVHVPLVIVGPGIPQGRIDYTVDSALDLAATVLDMAGLEPPADYDGISLLPLATGEWKPRHIRPVVVAAPPQWEGVIFGKMKLVKNKGTLSLFDLTRDPDERKDIADEEPELANRLSSLASRVLRHRTEIRRGALTKSTSITDDE